VDADGFDAQLVPHEVPIVVAPAATPVVPTAPAVTLAGTLLGEPAARPVTVLVCPVTTVVEVVNWT